MKPPEKYTLTFLTPCFCAGADQAVAEIRPSAIRGQLRWWFRALGGTREQERNVFGGIAKNEADIRSSAVIVRCGSVRLAPAWNPPAFSQNETSSYVWYFASVSGTTTKGHTGPRWNAQAVISPKSFFELNILYRHPLPSELSLLFQQALKCFLTLGGIGLRVTRGLGVFDCKEVPYNADNISAILLDAGFSIEDLGKTGDLEMTIRKIGSLVKGTRKDKGWTNDLKNGTETPSPMGTSGDRQTSAIYFRPIRQNNDLHLVAFEAPHQRVLGKPSRRPSKTVGQYPSQLKDARPSSRH